MTLDFAIRGQAGALQIEVAGTLPVKGVTVLFGASGAGKSTLLRMLAGLHRCDGTIRFGDQQWLDDGGIPSLPVWQRPLGMLMQQPTLFRHLTVQGNLDYVLKRRGKGADIKAIVHETRIAHLLDREVHTLSGGEAQRVALARALAGKPAFLLLDEPLSAVDLSHRESLLAMIKHIAANIPVLYVTHSLDEMLLLADQVWLMEQGRVTSQLPVTTALASLDGPLAKRSDASSLLQGNCAHFDADDHLQEVRVGDLGFLVPVSTALPTGECVRLRIAARDVSLCRVLPDQSSILNVLPASVIEVTPVAAGQHLVKLSIQGQFLLSRLSSRSVRDLNIKAGESVYAQVKAVALV